MLTYVTTNEGKVREAREYLDQIARAGIEYTEIQAATLGPIAAHGARDTYRRLRDPVIVDDAGLFLDALDGFPGPYSAYVEDTIGVHRLWEMVKPLENHRAEFRCVLGYCDGAGFEASPDPVDREDRVAAAASGAEADAELPVKLFEGTVRGRLVPPRGEGGFGYDPIFEYNGETFAEIDPAAKNALSHRGRALERFAEWYEDTDRSN